MQNKMNNAITGGIIGTAVMTIVMMIAPMMGMPKMNPAEMLSMMMGMPVMVGWIMHFMIGIVFALSYAYYFNSLVAKYPSNAMKGTIFGIAVFLFAQIMMGIMGMMMPMPAMEGSMMLMMLGSILGHIVFGISVAMVVKPQHK